MFSASKTIARRAIHVAPRLPKQEIFSKNGIQGLMSAEQFQMSWMDYQKFLTQNLTLKTVDSELETRNPMAIAMSTAKNPQKASIFHYASQAHNNHLFFQQLKESSVVSENDIKPALLQKIKNNFVSLENFKNELLFKADSLPGNGWVFLIEDEFKDLKILSCNNDGTPYFYGRNQSVNLSTNFDYNDFKKLQDSKNDIKNGKKDYSLPIICINVWEHAYLLDYGINGKAEYLENLWNCLDWTVINSRVFSNIEM